MKSQMSDPLLSQMAQIAREHVLADARWASFARGALPEQEEADLLAKAHAAGLDEETIEAMGPRSEAFDEGLADAALAAMDGLALPRSAPRPASQTGLAAAPAVTANDNRSPRAAERRARPGLRVVGAASALLAAAAAALLLLRPAAFPAYAMNIEGGAKAQRSSPDTPDDTVELGAENRVVITLRPDGRVPRKVAARAYLRRASERIDFDAPVEIADSGAVRIAAPAPELLRSAGAGKWDLCVDVRPAESPPASGEVLATVCRPIHWAGATGTGR